MTEMTLQDAIAEVKRLDHESRVIPDAVAQVLVNGLLSGALIPKADADLAVALAYQRAAELIPPSNLRQEVLALAPADALAEVARLRAEVGPELWLIHKAGRGWYRPNAQGYTNNLAEAGLYSYAAAMSHSHPNGPEGPRDGMTIKHVENARAAITTPEKDATP